MASGEFLPPSDTETHVKLPPREHCLKLGEGYLGDLTVRPTPFLEFIKKKDEAGKDVWTVEEQTANVSKALVQMVLEIITNATDHAERPDTGVKNIWITMDEASGRITVRNDGASIPVRMHTQYPDKHLTSVIFSEFMVSSNYDTKENLGAGRFGQGGKVTNTWSTEFRVHHHDGDSEFTETWSDNMSTTSGAKITKKKRKGTFTEVSFVPDFARLKIADIPGSIRYLRSFAWHLGAATNAKLTIHLDGQKLPVRGLKDYAKILANNQASDVAQDEGNGIEVAVIPLREGFPDTIGYVNSIPCHEGVHINYALKQVSNILSTTPAMVRGRCTLLVNARVPDPVFENLTKDKLTNTLKDTRIKWEPSKSFITKLRSGSVSKFIKEETEFRENRKAKLEAKSAGVTRNNRVVHVEGYESAGNAGRKNRTTPTTLILTEGLSAKQFAIAGLSVVGRENFGVFPLRGKPFNVLSGPLKAALKNAEVANFLKIMGCDVMRSEPYASTSELRYDRVCILSDQDGDGDHIAGLVVNIVNFFFPEIVKTNPGFVTRFSTPLVRATPKRGKEPPLEFTSESSFEEWWDRLEEKEREGFQVKYYKGLGTSTPREAKACFKTWDKSVVALDFTQQADRDLLSDCFGKGSDRRRRLIAEPGPPVDYGQASIVGGDFLRGDLILFSKYDNERNIAHAVDGLKPSQRKILWVMLTKHSGLTKATLKVAQLSGEVAKETHYKHGEDSLNGAIILMAQDYPTSGNSISLLVPGGMFGDRHGNDSASPRYIFTCMESITKVLFPSGDIPVLKRAMTEGCPIEPVYFVPVIPFALCNGSFGIGTGWSSRVLSHNPVDLIEWCRVCNSALTKGEDIDLATLPKLMPWIEGIGYGTRKDKNWVWKGTYTVLTPKSVRITGLPIKTNAFPSKKFAERHPHFIHQYSSDIDINMVMHFENSFESFEELEAEMTLSLKDGNMNLWRRDNKLALFATAEEVALHHAHARLDMYAKRKAHRLEQYRQTIIKLTDEYRFVMEIMETPTLLHKKTKTSITEYLTLQGYTPIDNSYDHLFRLTFLSATAEMLEKLKNQAASNQEDMDALEAMSPHDLWARELDELHQAYGEFEAARAERRANPDDEEDVSTTKTKRRKTQGSRAKKSKN